MEKKGILTKILAVAGTVFVWFPVLAPILFSEEFFINVRRFRIDYLMPAELFPVVLVGGGLLIWAALRAHSHLKMIAWGVGIAVGTLVVGQGLAMITGLASGANEAEGWRMVLVLGALILYVLAVIGIGIGGILLLRDLFKRSNPSTMAN
jgi:hypothetical protein